MARTPAHKASSPTILMLSNDSSDSVVRPSSAVVAAHSDSLSWLQAQDVGLKLNLEYPVTRHAGTSSECANWNLKQMYAIQPRMTGPSVATAIPGKPDNTNFLGRGVSPA